MPQDWSFQNPSRMNQTRSEISHVQFGSPNSYSIVARLSNVACNELSEVRYPWPSHAEGKHLVISYSSQFRLDKPALLDCTRKIPCVPNQRLKDSNRARSLSPNEKAHHYCKTQNDVKR